MKLYKLRNDIYDLPIYLVIWKNPDEFIDKLNRKHPSDDLEEEKGKLTGDGACSVFNDKNTGIRYYYVWLKKFEPKNPLLLAELAHEFYHLVRFQFKDLNIEENPQGEAGAYYFDYLFEQALRKLFKKKKGK